MNLVESLLGYRSFSSESEIRYSVEQSRYYDSSKGRRKITSVFRLHGFDGVVPFGQGAVRCDA